MKIFDPTFIIEKLKEEYQIVISAETLRSWMIETHLWIPKQKKRKQFFLRKRKQCFGELIQIDGSHHDWFEGRVERANQTLQDRLTKEMRLRNISTIEQANQ